MIGHAVTRGFGAKTVVTRGYGRVLPYIIDQMFVIASLVFRREVIQQVFKRDSITTIFKRVVVPIFKRDSIITVFKRTELKLIYLRDVIVRIFARPNKKE